MAGFERQLTLVSRGIFSASCAFCLLSGICVPSHVIHPPFCKFRWRQRSSPASKISQKREFLCLFSFGTPSCENFISCKTHEGPQEGFALNSPFIGQQIRPPKSHFKMKNDVLCRVFQTLSFRQSCAKRVENCLFQRVFQSWTSLFSFPPPLAQQVIRSTYIQSDSHLSLQSSW